MIFVEHVTQLDLNMGWQALFHHCGDFATPLTMSISNSEEMAIFEATEVRHSDPGVLILLVWI